MAVTDLLPRIIGWDAPDSIPTGLHVPIRAMRRALLTFIAVLWPLNLIVGWLKWLGYGTREQPLAVFIYFDFGEEQNLPAWVATMLLLVAAISSYVASQRGGNSALVRRGWLITAAALAYVSLDEATYLHERTSEPLRDLLGVGGPLYWAWVLPALVLVGVLAKVLWPFMQALDAPVRRDLFLSAGLFLGCAVGIEMIDGLFFSINEEAGIVTELLTMVEESGEMLAVMLFIQTALGYASRLPASAASGPAVA